MTTPAVSILLVGSSGSGKTTYAMQQAKQFGDIFVVNGGLDLASLGKSVEMSQVAETVTSNSILIFDDIIQPSDDDLKVLKKCLLWMKRHCNVTILMLMHSVLTNNTFQLIQHFDFTICTKTEVNFKNWTELGVKFLRFPKTQIKRIWTDFMNHSERYLYLKINMATHAFDVVAVEPPPPPVEQ